MSLTSRRGGNMSTQYQSVDSHEHGALLSEAERSDKIVFIYNAIREGADGFLFAEYVG